MNTLSKFFEPVCFFFRKWKISKKPLSMAVLALFIISLIPIFVMSFYAVASADDFTFGRLTHQAWEDSHSFVAVLKAAFANVVYFYFNWQGFYSANFVPSLNPFIFDEKLYFITTFVSVIIFVLGAFYLTYQILKRYFKADIYDVILVTCPILMLFFQLMPGASEWLFWFDAGQSLIFYGLLGLLIGIEIKCSHKNNVTFWDMLITVVVTVFSSGTSGISTFLLVFLFFKILNDMFLNKKAKSVNALNFVTIILVFIGFIVCLIAPGNSVRAETAVGMPFIKAIFMSFFYSFTYISTNNNIIAIIALTLILTPIAISLVKKSSFSFRYPLMIVILSYCIFASRFFNTLYSQSTVGSLRQRNGYFLFELALFAINVFYFWGWLYKKTKVENSRKLNLSGLSELIKRYSVIYVILVLCVTASALFQFGVKESTSISCSLSIVSGEAEQYKKEMNERLNIYLDDNIKDVKVKPLTSIPYVFMEDSVTDDPNDWKNSAIAKYYDKEMVVLMN